MRDPDDEKATAPTRIFEPIGLSYGRWTRDRSGHPHLPNGGYLTASEWIKFGQLILNDGSWNGVSLVRADLMRELAQPSELNPGHGLFLWLNQPGGYDPQDNMAPPNSPGGFIYPDGDPDMIGAMGAGKNRMYIFPSRDLVVVRQGDSKGRISPFDDGQFISLLFGDQPESLTRPTQRCDF